MTTVHANLVGDEVLLPRAELDRLVELARQAEEVVVHVSEDDPATGAALEWRAGASDLYSADDLKVRYR